MNVPLSQASYRQILPGRMRRGRRRLSFLICVVVPTILVLVFLTLMAVPRYSAQFRYSVVAELGARNDGNQLQLTNGQQSKHSDYVVTDYVLSQQAVSDLSSRMKLAAMFHPPGLDFLFRFWWDDGSLERLTEFWRNYSVSARYDRFTGLGSVQVIAFTPQDAFKIAQTLIELSETELNKLDQRARDSATDAVKEEVARSNARVKEVVQRLIEFRQTSRTFSPSKPADATEALAATIRQNLASLNTQYSVVKATLSPNSPAVSNLRAQIAATERELDQVLNVLGSSAAGPGGDTAGARLPGQLATYDSLDFELKFAADAHNVALRHLEQVSFNAKTQHLYMNAHIRPQLPKAAAYPLVFVWTAMTFVSLSVCWMIGTLLFFAMRDHTR